MNDTEQQEHKFILRGLKDKDYADIKRIMDRVYKGMGGAWKPEEFGALIKQFPEGQICIEDNGNVVGAALAILVNAEAFENRRHTYEDVVKGGEMSAHEPEGDALYGVDIFVDPDYRGLRLGRRLYDARKELCETLNLKSIIFGGRIPGYGKHSNDMTPAAYIQKVKDNEIYDPVLSFQLLNDFHIKKIMKNYIPEDAQSDSYGVLMEWNNIYYEKKQKLFGGRKSYPRIGVVQWQMRPFDKVEDFLHQAEFFVDAVAGYNSDIVLFPELVNAPLLKNFNQENPAEAMRSLSEYTEEIRMAFVNMAITYNINIVTGSMPELRDDSLYNVAFVCRRDGTWDAQYKLHITPDESQYWGLKGGDQLKIFDTDLGKIGVLICYDVEFPELSRNLADKGMTLLLVPFLTDTKNAYLRVRRCAQARAIENECYVAISGSVGNLPKVENMDIQYSQSAVFTPSDFAFPHDAIAAEATPNTEMTLMVDLDLDLLKELRQQGSVRNLQSRRNELYEVVWKMTEE
ncbi:Nitrilase/cyanide hydratase and apolipoprotein N-acyltransferase [Desulfatibacillum aliphaticivorans]|uniref:Nitrilase/cyanide hydratase and apolipoprotein N-acyltransferase n=1 Tax=Desulfatibacillum aliphaticivorans TaxID=218208 RepID=B8FAE1_DESAL|nr:bifunctional GNAT family N-acetyltransferase/carbon-nitrogen hydrolase family protein [Desulfatibacillum aliphaticivorans]ACL03237.1 Nitrilase/cyanide hydratase and apolipoprotein N-acyltransferase [Desulfatibacillum aliphaticivorans]